MYGIPLYNLNKEEEENDKVAEVQRRSFAFCSCSSTLRTIQQMMPVSTTPKWDQHAFQLLSTQSVLSVHKKAWDSCWFLHSAFNVILAYSPRPCTHTGKEGQTCKTGRAPWLLQRHLGPGFQAVSLVTFKLNIGDILHICSIFINNNNLKIDKGYEFWEGEGNGMFTVKEDSAKKFTHLEQLN